MLEFGTTRVELGVQTLDDAIYQLVRRGHGLEDVVKASTLLKEHGFKVHYHWMPGLPGSTPEEDLELSVRLFSDARFKPAVINLAGMSRSSLEILTYLGTMDLISTSRLIIVSGGYGW